MKHRQEIALAPDKRPVRRIGRGHRSVRGSAVVHGAMVAFESSLERDFLETLDFDPTVHSVQEQPCRIFYLDRAGRRRSYVPDFLVRHAPGTCLRPALEGFLYEVKHRTDLFAEWPTLKPKFRAARAWAHAQGLRFIVLTEREIRGTHLETVRVLNQYRYLEAHPGIEDKLAAQLVVMGEVSIRSLVEACWSGEDDRIAAPAYILRLIAIGRVVLADLGAPLTMDSLVWTEAGRGYVKCPYSYRLNRA